MPRRRMTLENMPAVSLMGSPLVTLQTSDTMSQAARILLEKRISAAPVIDHAGEPVGVLSKTDILRFQREYAAPSAAEWRRADETAALEAVARRATPGLEKEEDYVLHWMKPSIVAIAPDVSIAQAARMMAERHIHRLFVREEGELVGVLTSFDVLRAFSFLPARSPSRARRARSGARRPSRRGAAAR